MNTISTNNLTVKYNDHKVLDDITFDVKKGDVVTIVGPNGSGKSTLLKTLLGFIPYHGSAQILGTSPKTINKISDKIGYVPQVLNFDRTMPITVRELLNIYRTNHQSTHFKDTLHMFSVDSLLDKQLGVLSGGQFQRVLLALSLQNHPEILFLDEPTAGIDVEGAGEVYELIAELRKSDVITILMVSHDMDVVYKYSDQVLCLNHKLICQGVPAQTITPEILEQLYGKHQAGFKHH